MKSIYISLNLCLLISFFITEPSWSSEIKEEYLPLKKLRKLPPRDHAPIKKRNPPVTSKLKENIWRSEYPELTSEEKSEMSYLLGKNNYASACSCSLKDKKREYLEEAKKYFQSSTITKARQYVQEIDKLLGLQ